MSRSVKTRTAREHINEDGKATRTGYCAKHSRSTTSFAGVNEYGWVFFCRGSHDDVEEAGHYFVNQPPDGRLPRHELEQPE